MAVEPEGFAFAVSEGNNQAGDLALTSLEASGATLKRTPVTRALIIGGLMPCNGIPDEILSAHPQRLRGLPAEAPAALRAAPASAPV